VLASVGPEPNETHYDSLGKPAGFSRYKSLLVGRNKKRLGITSYPFFLVLIFTSDLIDRSKLF